MIDKLILFSCILAAFTILYMSIREILTESKWKHISKDLSLALSVSIVSISIIYAGIDSIGPLALLISSLAGLILFLTSLTILKEDGSYKSLEKK